MANNARFRMMRLPLSHLEIICCSVDPLGPWDHPDLAAPYWRLYYHDRRGAYVVWRRRRIGLPARRAVVIPPYTSFASGIANPPAPVVTQLFVHFIIPQFQWHAEPGVYVLKSMRQFDDIAADLISRTAGSDLDPGEGFRVIGAVMQSLARMPADAFHRRALDDRIRRAIELMTENAGAPVDNEMLAASVQMSTRTFTRAFARQVGTSPHQHLMKIRLDRAAVLLGHSDETIERIAEECGFNERSYFTRAFTKMWGAPPAAFRKATLRRWPGSTQA